MHAMNDVRRTSSRKVPQSVTYIQKQANNTKSPLTTNLGVPSQIRTFDSLSNFFITSSTLLCISSLETAAVLTVISEFVLFSLLVLLIRYPCRKKIKFNISVTYAPNTVLRRYSGLNQYIKSTLLQYSLLCIYSYALLLEVLSCTCMERSCHTCCSILNAELCSLCMLSADCFCILIYSLCKIVYIIL